MKGVTVKIGVIEGSIRQGRNAAPVARWVLDNVPKQNDAEFVLLDLASFNLPLYDAPVPPLLANRQYESEAVQAWSRAIDECDAFIFVSPEYNFGVPGVLKNAVDWLAPEWMNKSAAFVSYGSDGGIRSVEHWRTILANFNMHVVRTNVALSLFTDIVDGAVIAHERKAEQLQVLVEQLVASAAHRKA